MNWFDQFYTLHEDSPKIARFRFENVEFLAFFWFSHDVFFLLNWFLKWRFLGRKGTTMLSILGFKCNLPMRILHILLYVIKSTITLYICICKSLFDMLIYFSSAIVDIVILVLINIHLLKEGKEGGKGIKKMKAHMIAASPSLPHLRFPFSLPHLSSMILEDFLYITWII